MLTGHTGHLYIPSSFRHLHLLGYFAAQIELLLFRLLLLLLFSSKLMFYFPTGNNVSKIDACKND